MSKLTKAEAAKIEKEGGKVFRTKAGDAFATMKDRREYRKAKNGKATQAETKTEAEGEAPKPSGRRARARQPRTQAQKVA
jgi:hypothetical protein